MRIFFLARHNVCFVIIALLATGFDGSWKTTRAQSYSEISGRLITASGTLSKGTIAFFDTDNGSNPADRSILRIPERTALVNEQGRFAVKIQYGSYQLGYFSGEHKINPGIPENNTEVFFAGTSELNPYILKSTSPQIDTGDIFFYPHTKLSTSPSFTVQGMVRKKSGKPVAGISIVAKTDLNTFRPQYISMKTDKSGRYSLTLPPGSYYLVARHRLKKYGRPVTGEYFGIWGVSEPAGEFGRFSIKKDQDISIHGEEGQTITGADIMVFRIPDPTTQEDVLRSVGKK